MKFFVKYTFERDGKIYSDEKMIEAETKDAIRDIIFEQAVENGITKVDITDIIPIAVLHDTMVSEYEFKADKTPLGFKLSWNGLIFNSTNIKVKTDECIMHLEIITNIPAAKSEIIWQGKYNLYSERTTSELVKKCEEAMPEKDFGINWKALIQYWKKRLYTLLREGEAVEDIDISTITESTYSYLIEPFIIQDTINLIFAEGGTGKSSIALCFAMLGHSTELQSSMKLRAKPIKALYLDYENNKIVVQSFLKMLHKSYKIDASIKYRACHMPLQTEFESIANIIAEHDVDLVIIDSLAPACGDVLEVASIVNFYQCLQKLRKTILLIGHTPKNSENETVFGSVFFHNLARNVWQLKKKIISLDSFQLVFVHKKCNVSTLYTKPFVYELTYSNGGVQIKQATLEQDDSMSNTQLVIATLKKHGALTPKEIEEKTTLNYNTIKTILKRLTDKGVCVAIRDSNTTLYALRTDEPF
ncbi:MAG: AAA family ATPase [Candidatus Micrarchaeia archaeon]